MTPDVPAVDDIRRAIASKNDGYIVHHIDWISHAEMFTLFQSLSDADLNWVHVILFRGGNYLTEKASDILYSSTTAVTILRSRGIYSDVRKE
jgi:hypothetical protein